MMECSTAVWQCWNWDLKDHNPHLHINLIPSASLCTVSLLALPVP
uniref:Uncharacterized protein n=1 Tax=Anguilla anguilla TaxID=7936 RepID=A0A0E9W468_ANGAN